MFFSLFMGPHSPDWVIYLFAVVVGFATGGIVVMIYAIFPDIPDVDELDSGQRREAIFSAMVTFSRKLSSAVAIFLVSQVIGMAGYISPIQETIDGVTKMIEQTQTGSFLLALRLIFAFIPPFLLVVALIFAARYPLTPQRHEQLKRALARRRSGRSETPAETAEVQLLRSELIG
jgi:GPH family glycoside/pentoside/hexuronide:cation symporter